MGLKWKLRKLFGRNKKNESKLLMHSLREWRQSETDG